MEICGLLCQQAGECAVLLSKLNESHLPGESRSELHKGAGQPVAGPVQAGWAQCVRHHGQFSGDGTVSRLGEGQRGGSQAGL